jgi:hypothetical protein
LSDNPRGGFFVFDGVMVLPAGSVLPHRQDVYHKFGLSNSFPPMLGFALVIV